MAKLKEGIEIANPLYDAVFKHLMDNNKVAAYFIETFIGEKVESLTLVRQEIPVFKWSKKFDKFSMSPEELERLKKLTYIRLDFAATLKTKSGEYKKVLIEIQKSRNTEDVKRFRDYLAENYKRKEKIVKNNKSEESALPIIAIYLLGFNLPESDAIVFRVGRSYYDMIKKAPMSVKIPFAELLTHDSYIVQLDRITGKLQTRLEKVLSVFEQRYFINSKKKTKKNYPHTTEDEVVNLMIEILEHIAADPEKMEEIEMEWSSHEFLNSTFLKKEKEIRETQKALEREKKAREKDKRKIAEQGNTIEQQGNTIDAQAKKIKELERQLAIRDKN